MKIKKSTFNFILMIIGVIIFSYLVFKINNDAVINAEFRVNNEFCSNLTGSLLAINKSCYCYYQPFASGDTSLDAQTSPLCACDCIENGTPVKLGILISKT